MLSLIGIKEFNSLMDFDIITIRTRYYGYELRILILVKPISESFDFCRLNKSYHLIKDKRNNISNRLSLFEIHFSGWRVDNEREFEF